MSEAETKTSSPGPLYAELNSLQESLSELEETVTKLEERLGPLLLPPNPPSEKVEAVDEVSFSVGNSIRELKERISRVNGRITGILKWLAI